MKNVNTSRWLSLIIGILLIIGGILQLFTPGIATLSITTVLATTLVVTGVLRVFRYFSDQVFRSGGFLISAIIEIIMGAFMIYNMSASLILLPILVGFWILFNGVIEIAVSIDLKNYKFTRWWVGLISGILGIILGIVLIRNNNLSNIFITAVVATYMIILGITFITTFIELTRIKNQKE